MARGRFLSESVAKDARLNSLSVEAELVYLMTVPHLDRDGLIEGDPDVLWGTVCPKRRQFIDRMAIFVQEWAKARLVECYDTEDGVVLWFKGFSKNQTGLRYDRETPSTFAPPPGHTRNKNGIIPLPHEPPKKENLSPADSLRQNAGDMPETSGNSTGEVKDQVKDQDQSFSAREPDEDEEAAMPKEPTLDEQVFDRLEEEWATVNPGQMDKHLELAKRYGYRAWVAGLERCTRGKRSKHAYVEKAILSAIDDNPSLEPEKSKPPPSERFFYTDPVTGVSREVFV